MIPHHARFRRPRRWFFLLASGLLGCAQASPAGDPPDVRPGEPTPPIAARNAPDGIPQGELVVTLIGSLSCAGADNPELAKAFRAILNTLGEGSRAHGLALRSIGIALDQDPEDGDKFLRPFGSFSERLLGGGWSNTGAVRYVWMDLPGEPTIPQLTVSVRAIVDEPRIYLTHESMLARLIGPEEIIRWAHSSRLAQLPARAADALQPSDAGAAVPAPRRHP